jgi:hypothetical protein
MSGIFGKIVSPRYPSAAASIERGKVAVVQLDKTRQGFNIKRGATVTFSDTLVNPSFESNSNLSDLNELAGALSDAALAAGLGKQRKWSIALPEASTRSIILTLESVPSSKNELHEILRWKTERAFGLSEAEIQVSREHLGPDNAGRDRYLATAVRKGVLAEFEAVFESLSWRAGLILPRSLAEAQWLTGVRRAGDSLLVSSHEDGFTVSVYRNGQPLAVRSIICETADQQDELYRFLLFYRDRLASEGQDAEPHSIQRLLLAGDGFVSSSVTTLAHETLDTDLRPLSAAEVGLSLPTTQFSFRDFAAPAALASMAW